MSVTVGRPKKIWVWIDVSAACNLACRDCYTKSAHAPVLMSPGQFRDVLEKLSSPLLSVQRLHLNWRGEPLINKRLPEVLEIREKMLPSVPLEFHTHGLLLDQRSADEIVAHVLPEDLIYVSIDGGRRELHEANRGAGTWSPTLRGLRTLLNARERSRRNGPKIGIYEIFYGNRTRSDPELTTLARRCDEWTRVNPISSDGREASFDEKSVPEAPCFWVGNSLCITASGDVHVCLLSFRPDGRIGNIFSDDVLGIIARAAAFRASIARDRRSSITHCRNCKKTAGDLDES